MYHEDDYIQLSALQHYLFCPRQCALAYMEMVWKENSLTMQGHLLHEKVHQSKHEKRGDVITSFGLRLSSAALVQYFGNNDTSHGDTELTEKSLL